MVKAFLTIESMEERRQVGDAMTNIRDSVWKMPTELAQKLLPESFFVSLARALESVGKTAEAAEVLSTGRAILYGSQVAPAPAVAAPLLSFRLEDLPEGVKFEFFDGQVAEAAALEFVEKHGLTPIVVWTNRLARAVRDNLSAEMRENEAALESNRGPLLFLIPVEIPQEKGSVQCFMFCEHDRLDVSSFVQRFCALNGGAEEADRARCTVMVSEFIKKELSSLSKGSISVE